MFGRARQRWIHVWDRCCLGGREPIQPFFPSLWTPFTQWPLSREKFSSGVKPWPGPLLQPLLVTAILAWIFWIVYATNTCKPNSIFPIRSRPCDCPHKSLSAQLFLWVRAVHFCHIVCCSRLCKGCGAVEDCWAHLFLRFLRLTGDMGAQARGIEACQWSVVLHWKDGAYFLLYNSLCVVLGSSLSFLFTGACWWMIVACTITFFLVFCLNSFPWWMQHTPRSRFYWIFAAEKIPTNPRDC